MWIDAQGTLAFAKNVPFFSHVVYMKAQNEKLKYMYDIAIIF